MTVEISIDLGVCDCLHTEAYVSLKSQTMTKSQITADSVGKATHIKLKTEESTDWIRLIDWVFLSISKGLTTRLRIQLHNLRRKNVCSLHVCLFYTDQIPLVFKNAIKALAQRAHHAVMTSFMTPNRRQYAVITTSCARREWEYAVTPGVMLSILCSSSWCCLQVYCKVIHKLLFVR